MTVHLIAAVGRRGQIGRDGHLPWENRGDLSFFRDMTIGGVVIVGHKTVQTLPSTLPRRIVWTFERDAFEEPDPKKIIKAIEARYRAWPIWVCGGAACYRAFAPYVDGLRLFSSIDYDNDPLYDDRHTFFPFDAYSMEWR